MRKFIRSTYTLFGLLGMFFILQGQYVASSIIVLAASVIYLADILKLRNER